MPRTLADSIPVPTLDAAGIERFTALIQSTGRGCWNWDGYTDPKGYGQFRIEGQSYWAHRVAYTIANGPIPRGLQVHHQCGNPSCVNPAHLELATPSENAQEGARFKAEQDAEDIDIPY